MASAGNEAKYFCHSCMGEVVIDTNTYTCSQCSSGFIEEVENVHRDLDGNDLPPRSTSSRMEEEDHFVNEWQNMFNPLLSHRIGGRGRSGRGSGLFSHSKCHVPQKKTLRQDSGNTGIISQPGGRGALMFQFHTSSSSNPSGMQMQGANPAIDSFIQQFFNNLGVQVMGGANGGMSGSFGDYAWGPNGLDNIITQLLNQLDSTGPPPADQEKIKSLPITQVTQDEVDRHLDCAVCQEKYILDEDVKRLPCAHIFHPACVEPWLELHDSCPICRCNLNGDQPSGDS